MFNVFLAGGASDPGSTNVGHTLYGWLFSLEFFILSQFAHRKQEKEHALLIESAAIGDSVLTSSGFYGVIIDVMDDIVIVEFGNNKNCRIPMKISNNSTWKPGQAKEEVADKKDKK